LSKPLLSIYCDGSSTGRVGAGGWAYVLVHEGPGSGITGQGGETGTTNNRMELLAAIRGLEHVLALGLTASHDIELVSDSQYVLGLASGAYVGHANTDLVAQLQDLARQAGARTRWVPGHSGNHYNDLCDVLAKAAKAAVT
jgi:ribonuclease HI